jgi:Flp pilus assembly pilin Flp
MKKLLHVVSTLLHDEEGASLAEYLVLLGVLVLAVGGGILAFGGAINDAFQGWSEWLSGNVVPPDLGT